PEDVVVYQPVPVYHYYPWGYPLYYYPYSYGYPFGFGFFWGVTIEFRISWHSHYVHCYPYGYYGHPYYGHTYYNPLYVRNNVNVNVSVSHGNYVWQPHYVHGAQPFTRSDGRQLAVAHRDPNVGGAPSGYRNAGRSPSPALHSDGRTSTTGAPRVADKGAPPSRGTRGEQHAAPPPVRVAPAPSRPAPYSAPHMAAPRQSGGEAYASRAPRSAPQRGEAGHSAQGHAFEGRGNGGGHGFR